VRYRILTSAVLVAGLLVVGPAHPTESAAAALPVLQVPLPATDPAFATTVGARPTDLTGGRVVAYDPRGQGQAVVVFGDLASARHVAVYVPGSGTDLRHLAIKDRPWRRTLGAARSLAEEARRLHPDEPTAVVAWLGYDAPDDLFDSADGDLARSGAPALVRYVDGLRAAGPAGRHVTIVGHSYGTVLFSVAGSALDADDLVALGSPGLRVRRAADLDTRARLWVALADDDWIRRVPNRRIGDLGHGTDPASPEFGARLLPTRDTAGHDGYLAPGTDSLRAVARVVTGQATS
jgi:Alpha/beta hydrolase